jgi:hypothetical protein
MAHMLMSERATERRQVPRIIQIIGDFGVTVLGSHFVNLHDRFLGHL